MTEQEELQMLRTLAAKQKKELEEMDRIIKERDTEINQQDIQIENLIRALTN